MGIFSFLGIRPAAPASGSSAYDFAFKTIDGGEMGLAGFSGKVLLIVNTASECGFTKQYKELEELYEQYKARGLVVIGVPSNDFGGQEPGSEAEIKNFCEAKFGVSFPLTAKEIVKGDKAHPFYKWAASQLGLLGRPKWNFHKYLVDKNGNITTYFLPTTSPVSDNIKAEIERLLA